MAPSNTTSTIDSSYHIGGNLYLPDPETCGLMGERLARARELQPLLEQLNARDLRSESRNLISLKSSNLKVQKSLGHPRPFRAKAPAKLKSLEANISSSKKVLLLPQKRSKNGVAFCNAAVEGMDVEAWPRRAPRACLIRDAVRQRLLWTKKTRDGLRDSAA